jgi:hypothetical protein
VGECINNAGPFNYFFQHYYADFYAMLGDDSVPRTRGWDYAIAKAATPDKVAYPNDGLGHCTCPAVGGDLVREMGWFTYPGIKQLYADTQWFSFARHRNILVYLSDVLVEHMHWSAGKSPYDDTYARKRTHKENDAMYYRRFLEEKCNVEISIDAALRAVPW